MAPGKHTTGSVALFIFVLGFVLIHQDLAFGIRHGFAAPIAVYTWHAVFTHHAYFAPVAGSIDTEMVPVYKPLLLSIAMMLGGGAVLGVTVTRWWRNQAADGY